jgi:Raf kinase inhibitor-like YbhB/YbcL family protein
MSRRTAALLLLLTAVACKAGTPNEPSASATLRLSSPAFGDGDSLPVRSTCDVRLIIPPPLEWERVPGASSYALVMTDPDAPNGTFVHWVVYGIREPRLPKGAVVDLQGTNSQGEPTYAPPCPPQGDPPHRYVFKVYAVRGGVDLPGAGATVDELFAAIEGNVIARGELTGTYAR